LTEALTGYEREELLAMNFWEVIHPDFRELVKQRGRARQRGERVPTNYEVKLVTKNGDERWVDFTLGVIEFEGKPAVLGTGFDITERKQAEEALRESEERFRTLVESTFEGIVISENGKILQANESFAAMFGYELPEVVGLSPSEMTTPESAELIMKNIRSGNEKPYEITGVKKDGATFDIEVIGRSCLYQGRNARVTAFRDITEMKRAEETIKHLAYHDPLTDLPNRTLFEDRLTIALAQARRKKRMLAVMFLDLDHFKVVNDTVGHAEGDKLLRSVGERLTGLVREGDTVARVGGDEFALLSAEVAHVDDAAEIAERVLEGFRRSWVLRGHEFHVTTSVGIAVYPGDGDDAETLLRNADTAMYRAKERGRDNYQLYTPAMNARIAERLAVENDLRHGLERGEFVVYYQPQVNIDTGQIVGMEALVRWQHPEQGLVLPAEFIPVAEETGLIVPLGEWVLRTACAQNRTWQEAGFPPLRVAVNLSARQFQQRNLIETVARVLKETGLDAHWLQLEITEGVAMQDADLTIAVLRDLRAMGVQISIDDFGTGYSSLSYLKRFPIDVVKIDRSFVRDITVDESDAAIATAVIDIAHNLKLKVIAEGVETEEQLAFLKKRRCDEMQGYLFSRPVPAREFHKMLAQVKRRSRARRPVAASR
jgi:diguanylate cyclase (GGDEF)-like protein/PAS domain S-box-containing protein